jgi:hypothetical protein
MRSQTGDVIKIAEWPGKGWFETRFYKEILMIKSPIWFGQYLG